MGRGSMEQIPDFTVQGGRSNHYPSCSQYSSQCAIAWKAIVQKGNVPVRRTIWCAKIILKIANSKHWLLYYSFSPTIYTQVVGA